jgi:hypothetical protein
MRVQTLGAHFESGAKHTRSPPNFCSQRRNRRHGLVRLRIWTNSDFLMKDVRNLRTERREVFMHWG